MNKVDTITIIRSLLTSTNSLYNIKNLNRDFKKETGIDIPLFGYNNLADFFLSIPDTLQLTGVYPNDKVSLVANEKSGHIISLVKRQKGDKQMRLNSLCKSKSNSKGITVKKQRSKADDCEECPKNPESMGVNQLQGNKKQTIMCDKIIYHSFDCNVMDSYGIEKPYFKDFLHWGEKILPINLNHYVQVGKYVEVHLCQIYNPGDFHLQLRVNKKKFERFMSRLRNFYASQGESFKMANDEIIPKQICVALHKLPSDCAKWYRCEVTEIVDDFKATVFLIDYGVTINIRKKNLRFLQRSFSIPPRQAVFSSLANVRPAQGNSNWTTEANKRFFELAFDKDLIAGVVNLDIKTCLLKVALSSTSELEIHINDTLVKEGYATFETENLCLRSDLKTSNFCKKIEKRQWKGELGESDLKEHEGNIFFKHFPNGISPNSVLPVIYSPNDNTKNVRLKKMLYV